MPITIRPPSGKHAARFSSPVYPGDTVTMEMWKDGNVISFEAKVNARNVTVIKSGKTVLGDEYERDDGTARQESGDYHRRKWRAR